MTKFLVSFWIHARWQLWDAGTSCSLPQREHRVKSVQWKFDNTSISSGNFRKMCPLGVHSEFDSWRRKHGVMPAAQLPNPARRSRQAKNLQGCSRLPFPDPTDLHQRRLLISINQSSIFQHCVPSEKDSWYSGEPAPLMWLSKALTQTCIMYEVPRWHSLFQYFKNSQISWIVCFDFHTIQLQWNSATLYPIEEAFLLYNWGHRMSSPEAYPMSLLWMRSSQRDFYISLKQWQMIRMKYVSSRYSDLIKPFLTNFNYILI
jgi:hypothetical protein